MKQIRLAVRGLALINLICACLHLIFQFRLMNSSGELKGFIMTENIMIAVVFVSFAVGIMQRKERFYAGAVQMSVIFWSAFVVVISLIRPQLTTLSIFGQLPAQSFLLLSFGLLAWCLSLFLYRHLGDSTGGGITKSLSEDNLPDDSNVAQL